MAWRKPTNEDLVAALSQVEVDEYKKSPEFEENTDPTAEILADTAEFVRGYVRRLENKGGVKMHPDAGYIPASLMNPAMDIAAFRVLKRFNLSITDARQKAYDSALDILKDVAEEKLMPESYAEDEPQDDDFAGIVPLYGMDFNPNYIP